MSWHSIVYFFGLFDTAGESSNDARKLFTGYLAVGKSGFPYRCGMQMIILKLV